MKYFEDEHEGNLGNSNIEFREFARHVFLHKDKYFELRKAMNLELRDTLHINCWHIANYESQYMWDEYCKNGNGVAIRTTCKKLVKALDYASEAGYEHSTTGHVNDHCVQIGRVKYVNYEETFIPEDSLWAPFLHKRKKYSRENELRCMVLHGYDSKVVVDKYEKGTNVIIDLTSLIDQLHISPYSEVNYENVVKKIMMSANIQKEIVRSSTI